MLMCTNSLVLTIPPMQRMTELKCSQPLPVLLDEILVQSTLSVLYVIFSP